MDNAETKFRVSIGSFTFEISGSREYVKEQVDLFKPTILSQLESHIQVAAEANCIDQVQAPAETGALATLEIPNPYPNVMHWDSTHPTQLLAKAPGKSKQEQMQNAILLYLLAKELQGVEIVSADELKNICMKQGCLDASNFTHAYSDMKLFLLGGGARNRQVSLTNPGVTKAKKMAQLLNDLPA